MSTRRWLMLGLLLTACGSDQSLEYDLYPIGLDRAPVQPGGPRLGGLLAKVDTSSGLRPLLVDTAFPYDSIARGDCPSSQPGWTYTGRMQLHDGIDPTAPLRASFSNTGLFDICPGPSGETSAQPFGVMGGPLLANFAVELAFPIDAAESAEMTLWPGFPGSDDQLAEAGQAVLRFDPRGSFTVAQGNGESSLSLPNARVVLAACAAPPAFASTDPVETCKQGETGIRASGEDLMLAVGTGEGPTILSQSAWERVASALGLAPDQGTPGALYTPFSDDLSVATTAALFVSLPRMALFQGTVDSSWLGACAELARARRIEWTLANQDNGSCFQPCDVSGSQAITTRAYLELAGDLLVAVVPDTSTVILSLNADVPVKPHVDGIVGAATLAGTRLTIDYLASPQGRVIATCLESTTRDTCFAAPSCPSLHDLQQGQSHGCFGQRWTHTAPACTGP